MPALARGLAIISVLLACIFPVLAEDAPPAQPPAAPTAINEETARLLELGKLLMGQNNPDFALVPEKLPIAQRNAAGDQALRTFKVVVKREPRLAEGWLWLGIALTQSLQYSRDFPQGRLVRTEPAINEGLTAFRTAYECDATGEDGIKYYSDALMEFRKDFDTALTLWEKYLARPEPLSDLQRMIANVQAARACLNKAYFGKEDKLPIETIRKYYNSAVTYLQQASALFPNARDVKEMQLLLQQYKQYILGKSG